MTEKEVYDLGFERGESIASWAEIPEIGDKIDRSVDWIGCGDVVTEDNLEEYCELLCFAAEENSRQFSPFEITAKDLNDLEETADFEVWETYDDGIAEGIRSELKKCFEALKE